MTPPYPRGEHHYIHRIGWLRAAVLGANDGILSTGSLMIGVAAAAASTADILIAGIAALAAGAMSMAAGEYVSVSSQADTEKADIETEKAALKDYPDAELQELADIYIARGVEPETARAVAEQLSRHDALGAHARDELGMTETAAAQPVLAAFSSAASFAAGALLPFFAAVIAPEGKVTLVVGAVSLISLALLGWVSARIGGASPLRAIVRVVFWGAAAMLITGLIGRLFGTVV